jgi:hypothetical protein
MQRKLPRLPLPTGHLGGAEPAAVILAQRFLLAVAELPAAFDAGGVRDLVLGRGKHDQFAVELGSADRREAVPGAKQAMRTPGSKVIRVVWGSPAADEPRDDPVRGQVLRWPGSR